tara:strand:+ start:127 stop:1023 length:897 start_codon:yes stop_codon:yes gene_type:complete
MKNKKKLISIIVNCYNGEKFLRESLTSIQNQEYKNWELIFWDNKSNDNSKKIFKSFKNKKFKYFSAKKHTSLYEARNLAIAKCKGEFISFLDTDDTWEKDKLNRQIKFFKNKKVGVVYGNLWILNEKYKKKKIFSDEKLLSGMIFNAILKNYNIGIITTLIRAKVLKINKIKFNKKFNHIGDFDLFIKLSKICQFKAIQDPVATYRIHGSNLSLKNTYKEINELQNWFKNNSSILNEDQRLMITKRLQRRKFIFFKLEKNFFSTLIFFIKNKNVFTNIKNLFILFTPVFILKKVMWYQ